MSFRRDHADARLRPSPNCGARRPEGRRPDILLLHYTGMSDGESAERRLCHPGSEVSCHYLVHEDGVIVQMVPEVMRAWHAGVSSWEGRDDVNSRSVGIEIVNKGHDGGLPDYPDRQIDAVISLCRAIIERHGIAARRVLAHSDVAPGRKIDPGERFPWRKLAGEGIGLWDDGGTASSGLFLSPGDRGQPVEALQGLLSLYGYDVAIDGEYDDRTRLVVDAFQRHYRPERVDGRADRQTIDRLYRLLQKAQALPDAG